MNQDRPEYLAKKARFARILTIYGRKPILEALQSNDAKLERLHLSSRNKKAAILDEIKAMAEKAGAEIIEHSPEALARISRNGKQDQGIAADIHCPNFTELSRLFEHQTQSLRLLALDRVTNPQNLGMIIRSVTASKFDGLIVPRRGCAPLSPMVIKASAGSLFRAPIIQVESLKSSLELLGKQNVQTITLDLCASDSMFDFNAPNRAVYLLGNETEGVSDDLLRMADKRLRIPMERGVESLNVAVTAALVCFLSATS